MHMHIHVFLSVRDYPFHSFAGFFLYKCIKIAHRNFHVGKSLPQAKIQAVYVLSSHQQEGEVILKNANF